MINGVGLFRTLTHWFEMRPQLLHYWNLTQVQTDTLTVCRADACFWFSTPFVVPVIVGLGMTTLVTMRALGFAVALIIACTTFMSAIALGIRLAWQRFPDDASRFHALFGARKGA